MQQYSSETRHVLATVLFCVVASTAVRAGNRPADLGAAGIRIRTLIGDKVLYDFNEDVRLDAVITNTGRQTQSLSAAVVIKRGVDTRIELPEKPCSLPPGEDVSLTFTWKDGEDILYIDGLEATADPKLKAALDFGNLIRVGGETYNYENSGKNRVPTHGRTGIDEMRIYDRALSPTQIRYRYEHVMGQLVGQDDF